MSKKNKPLKNLHIIYDPSEMWVLSSPIRVEVLNTVCGLEECSAAQIAAFTGRSRTSLYPHIEQLVEAGLLIESDVRLAGKRYEQLYRPIARTVATKHNSKDPENVAYHQAYGNAVGRLMARLHERATGHPEAVVRGELRDTNAGIHTAWVDDDDLKEINSLIERIWEISRNSEPSENKRLINVGIMIAPDARNNS
ncbi:MAG: helix-turn-helix domain-containing protein [Phycisphaerales bacterium]|nr:helix-turn-helix domain-containing protein [Phycisphaerales bacterium]